MHSIVTSFIVDLAYWSVVIDRDQTRESRMKEEEGRQSGRGGGVLRQFLGNMRAMQCGCHWSRSLSRQSLLGTGQNRYSEWT